MKSLEERRELALDAIYQILLHHDSIHDDVFCDLLDVFANYLPEYLEVSDDDEEE